MGLVAAISVSLQDPVFESQTKIKLGSTKVDPNDPNSMTVQKFIGDFVVKEIDRYLHINHDVADVLLKEIQKSEKERNSVPRRPQPASGVLEISSKPNQQIQA